MIPQPENQEGDEAMSETKKLGDVCQAVYLFTNDWQQAAESVVRCFLDADPDDLPEDVRDAFLTRLARFLERARSEAVTT